NLAWGLVDAVMYLVRTMAERGREGRAGLSWRDWVAAAGVFVLVVLATFPVVLPFLFIHDLSLAMNASRAITLVMLFGAGFSFARYAGHRKPARIGLAMALFGAALILAVIALGG